MIGDLIAAERKGRVRGTRADRLAAILALQEAGMSNHQIMRSLAISQSTFYGILNDPTGERERARRDSYGGTCEDCGARTSGSNGRTKAPKLCAGCTSRRQHEARYWTQATIVAAIQRWNNEHGSPPRATDWLKATPRGIPGVSTVMREFGSWSEGIRAAGFVPRAIGRYERTPAWRRANAERLRARNYHRYGRPEERYAKTLEALRAFATELGRTPTWHEWLAYDRPAGTYSGTWLVQHYGWSTTIAAAGLTPRKRGERIDAIRRNGSLDDNGPYPYFRRWAKRRSAKVRSR